MICSECQKEISARRLQYRAVTCSTTCSEKRNRRLFAEVNPINTIPRLTVAIISQLAVTADLLRKGCEIFAAVSPSCSCDLIAHFNGALYRVEVRTGYHLKNGNLAAGRKTHKADIFAVVSQRDGSITYQPDFWGSGAILMPGKSSSLAAGR